MNECPIDIDEYVLAYDYYCSVKVSIDGSTVFTHIDNDNKFVIDLSFTDN